jgi:hypothetical protein
MAGQCKVKKAASARNTASRSGKMAGNKAPAWQNASDSEAEEPHRKKTRLGTSGNNTPMQPTHRVTVKDVDDDEDDVADIAHGQGDESGNEDEELGKAPGFLPGQQLIHHQIACPRNGPHPFMPFTMQCRKSNMLMAAVAMCSLVRRRPANSDAVGTLIRRTLIQQATYGNT